MKEILGLMFAALAVHNVLLEMRLRQTNAVLRAVIKTILEDDELGE